MSDCVITAANSITAVGHDGAMTSASVRAGISRLRSYDRYLDQHDQPITAARIAEVVQDRDDGADRLGVIAADCLDTLLSPYRKRALGRTTQVRLFLGLPAAERPGPRFEESCGRSLGRVLASLGVPAEIVIILQGNAAAIHALADACRFLEKDPGALCVVGGVDCLLDTRTLNWFEQHARLKSHSHGRHQGVIAGEAVSFLTVEDRKMAGERNSPLLGRIAGLGLAREKNPRAFAEEGINGGLTEACRAALSCASGETIGNIFGDLNGEASRAREWAMAEMRCFSTPEKDRTLWKPARSYGDIGAATGAVLANIVIQGFLRQWLTSPTLVFCSDDHGACGVAVLEKAG